MIDDSCEPISKGTPAIVSATTRVLQTPELLGLIVHCEVLSENDLLNCAVVSRFWSDLSLDELWSTAYLSDLLLTFPCVKQVHFRAGSSELVRMGIN